MSVWTNPITVGYGIACAAVMVLTLATLRRHQDHAAVWLGALMLALWGLSKVSIVIAGYWPTASIGPLVNAVAVVLCMLTWVRRPAMWKLTLALLLEAKAAVHAYFWTLHLPAYEQVYGYALALNVIFALQLLCVATPGAIALGSVVGSWMHGLRGDRRHHLPSGAS